MSDKNTCHVQRNSLRHLYFDSGRGLDIPTAEKLGWGCIFGSVILTLLTVTVL